MAKWDLSKLPEGRKPLPDEWFAERAQMQERIEELEEKVGVLRTEKHADAECIEELEADNARLETEAKLQAEEIDKTRRRADKWQSMVLDCGEYLKPGETPAERIEREINDCLALMKLLEKKQMRIQELEERLKAAQDDAKRWLNGPLPADLMADLADILDDEDYPPEKRAHQIVWQALKWMMENPVQKETHNDQR